MPSRFKRTICASSLLLSEGGGYHFIRSAMHGFGPVVLAELADGPTGCGEVARGGCIFACNFSVKRTTVLTEAERRARLNMSLH